MPKGSLTYKQTGVDYDAMDQLKRMAQIEGKKTIINLNKSGMQEVVSSRGESAYVIENDSSYLAFVQEGLGTKSLVADATEKLTGKSYYEFLAQDTVAMIVNDLITVGAKPTVIMAYWAVGSADWFSNTKRMENLVSGWAKASNLSGAVWGGGETPTLSGIIEKDTIDLAGACFGTIDPKKRLTLGQNLRAGDEIIMFESSGIHANGLTLARKIAGKLPKGYGTKLPDGSLYGEALLQPTIIYAKLIQSLFDEGVDIHYMVNITGHGWRKLMRHTNPFTYRVTSVPPVPAILHFIMEQGPLTEKEAYANLNMGAGYAVFVPSNDVEKVLNSAKRHKIKAYRCGFVEDKQLIIEPRKIIFEGKSLKVRG